MKKLHDIVAPQVVDDGPLGKQKVHPFLLRNPSSKEEAEGEVMEGKNTGK